jgi:hypothetical protein
LFINEVRAKAAPSSQQIELYNGGAVPLSLAGFRLAFNDGELSDPFGALTIEPAGFVVLDAIDFGFDLGSEETFKLTLVDDAAALVDMFGPYSTNTSVGWTMARLPDGGENVNSMPSTMGLSNL